VHNKNNIFTLFLIAITILFRFFNLNWGSPFYFHPDERNIASSIAQLNFPNQMNPNFFAYGTFPIYLVYFTGYILDFFLKGHPDFFVQAILISRFYSATVSLLLVFSIYFVGKEIANKRTGILAAIFSIFSIGFIQFAHFGTVEMMLTFLGLWFFYFSLQLVKNLNPRNVFITGAIFGLLLATKMSSLPLLGIPLLSVLANFLFRKTKTRVVFAELFASVFVVIFVSFFIFALLSPYVFSDFSSFLSSMRYESSVALGTLPVFYTAEFFNTVPVVFQFINIYPFLINPLLTIIFIPTFFYVCLKGVKTKNAKYLLLIVSYLILFLSQAFLFVKWTRYMVPTLPFVYLIISIGLKDFLVKSKVTRKLVLVVLIFVSIVFSTSYFIAIFTKQDSRIEASYWAKANIKDNPNIISEVYDLGIISFNPFFSNITLFNFYDLDNAGILTIKNLNPLLQKSEYIIVPSNRIMKTRIANAKQFPVGHQFYTSLFNNKAEFEKIYETPCDIFCKITYLNNPVFSFEYTASVFDRPTLFIFKKI
jgi:hypothetical protein